MTPTEAITLRAATLLRSTEFHIQNETEIRTELYRMDGTSEAGTRRGRNGTLRTQFVPQERNRRGCTRRPDTQSPRA